MLLRVVVVNQCCFSEWIDGPIELGRQHLGEPSPYQTIPFEGRTRVILARYQNLSISRHHLIIEPLSENRVRLTNVSSAVPVRLGRHHELRPGDSLEKSLPLTLQLGTIQVELRLEEDVEETDILDTDADDSIVQKLSTSRPPTSNAESLSEMLQVPQILKHKERLSWEEVVDWLRNAVKILQVAATSEEFFQSASQAAVGLIGLDSARVLTYKKRDWHVEALATRNGGTSADWRASRSVLNSVRAEKRTFWQSSPELGTEVQSLTGLSSVMAAPILNEEGHVVAVLYGDRKINLQANGETNALTELDATLMELFAFGVGAGLARLEQERNALAAQARFEEFFTPRLSKQLMNDSSILRGQEREVTILFCDIRRFSQFTEQFGHRLTVSWLNDVLGILSEVILHRDGVLVDYSGDQVMAMWGAPEERADHARQACETALDILDQIQPLNRRWSQHLKGKQTQLGIGISTGTAFVGNIGSHRKFKYGALGNVVNQASRIQNATKQFQCPVLLSTDTVAQLPPELVEHQTRRVGRVKLRHIEDSTTLHQLVPAGTEGFEKRKTWLESFEAKLSDNRFADAVEILDSLLQEFPDDGPALSYRKQLTGQSVQTSQSSTPGEE